MICRENRLLECAIVQVMAVQEKQQPTAFAHAHA
jgi:hypothetical protein